MTVSLPDRQQRSRGCALSGRSVVVALVALYAALLLYGAAVHSPVNVEVAALPAGIAQWHFARFDVSQVNPPLTRFVAASPVLFADAKTDWSVMHAGPGARPEWALGGPFFAANGPRTFWL